MVLGFRVSVFFFHKVSMMVVHRVSEVFDFAFGWFMLL